MITLRALAFNLYFFGLTAVLGVVGLFVRAFARRRIFDFARFWARLVIAGARHICGIRVSVSGLEHLPAHGPALLASEHQSAFDTLIWMTLLARPSYVVKHELTRIPLFGPLLAPAGMIPVDREAGAAALRGLLGQARQARQEGRQIIIFPQGTRVEPGQRVRLQPGIAAIAAHLDLPVTPVATDSGAHWGRRAFLKFPGTIHIAIGPPIEGSTRRGELLAAIEAFWREAEAACYRPVDNSVDGLSPRLPLTVK
jgi:1-acyl-sn-glycerol-3-phosphate acyltransferase